jgi:hypothetical protein
MFSRSWFLAAALVAGGSLAQTAPHSAVQAAAQPAAVEPAPLKYESTFTGYQAYRDGKRGDWRELNDTVRTLGGHAGHIRGSAPEQTEVAPMTAPATTPATAPGAPAAVPPRQQPPQTAPVDPHAGHKR